MAEPTINTNRLFALLRKLGKGQPLNSRETTELSNEILNMAGINTIAQFGAQLSALQAKLDMIVETNKVQLEALRESNEAQLEALRESNQSTRRLLGIGLTIIGLVIAYGTFFAG